MVWAGFEGGSDYEIFLYDGNSTTQLTNNSYNDYIQDIYESKVVWVGKLGSDVSSNEIFFYDGNSTIQLTNNSYRDWEAQVYGSNVVWSGYDGNDWEIFLYDGNSTTQLTNNSYTDSGPQVYESNVVWTGGEGASGGEIFLYDGNSTTNSPTTATWTGIPSFTNPTWFGPAALRSSSTTATPPPK